MGIIKRIKIIKNKSDTSFINSLNKFSRVNECLLCGKKMSSACNSHVVPQFILKNIAENGEIAYGNSLNNINIGGLKKITGINNAYTFRLICSKCDKEFFRDYENPHNLLNFDVLDRILKEKILIEMAIKARLSHISMKYRSIVMKDMVTGGHLAKLEQEGKHVFAERIDMNSHFYAIDRMYRHFINGIYSFEILFNVELDYKVFLATQTIISINYDLLGHKTFNPYDLSPENIGSYFYLMILPFDDRTRIIFYIEKEYVKISKDIIKQFNDLSFDEKLNFLFIALILHDEQFYMSPSMANYIRRNDKKIIRLYSKSERDLKHTKNIKNFRKYNNYLSKEKSSLFHQ